MNKKRDTFIEVHGRYYPLVFSVVSSKVDNLDDVLDICQEVFIDFYEKFEEVQDHRKWLYGALRFSVLKYYRKLRGTTVSIDEVFDDIGLTFVNGFRDTRILISDAMENISLVGSSNDDMVLFNMIAIHNFSYREAGKQLGYTKRQVEYRYRQIVDRILDYLRKKGINHIEEIL